jgi:PAS domain-containing protein
MAPDQRPIELILARNFLSSVSTPAFLVDALGEIVFYNEGAGRLLGRRFEEAGRMPAEEWTTRFGPLDDDGNAIPYKDLPLTVALRQNCPAHAVMTIRATDGTPRRIEASAMPILGAGGFQGALVIFWPTRDGGDEEDGR